MDLKFTEKEEVRKAVVYKSYSTAQPQDVSIPFPADSYRVNLNVCKVVRIFEETDSMGSELLNDCIAYCREQQIHTLWIADLAQLGNSIKDILSTLQQLTESQINLHIENLAVDTLDAYGTTAAGKLIQAVLQTSIDVERRSVYIRLQKGKMAKKDSSGANDDKPKTDSEWLQAYPNVVAQLKKGKTASQAAARTKHPLSTVRKVQQAMLLQSAGDSQSETSLARLAHGKKLSPNVFSALLRQGMTDLDQLANFSDEELLNIKGMGIRGVEQVKRLIGQYGIIRMF